MTLYQVNQEPAGIRPEAPDVDDGHPAPPESPAMAKLTAEIERLQAKLADSEARHVGLYVPRCSLTQASKNEFFLILGHMSPSVTAYCVYVCNCDFVLLVSI